MSEEPKEEFNLGYWLLLLFVEFRGSRISWAILFPLGIDMGPDGADAKRVICPV